MEARAEQVDFGKRMGCHSILQWSYSSFNAKNSTTTIESTTTDFTGLRVYSGAIVGANLISLLISLGIFDGCNIIEIGCGSGALSLLGFRKYSSYNTLVLTDGEEQSVLLAQQNLRYHHHDTKREEKDEKIHIEMLLWGPRGLDTVTTLLNTYGTFNIVVGSDLMYYNVNVDDLVTTIAGLTSSSHRKQDDDDNGDNGDNSNSCDGGADSKSSADNTRDQAVLFLHTHLFRKPNQQQELYSALDTKLGWKTYRLPIRKVMDAEDIRQWGASYTNIDVLISGNNEGICKLMRLHRERQKDGDGGDSGDSGEVNGYKDDKDAGEKVLEWKLFEEYLQEGGEGDY